jgi:EAL domain-containing protein (putative c-di-GMP-specific phosphodiesterase class I)
LRAVVGLCEALGVATVAEHVESEELLKLVRDLGCNAGQGFWLMRPVVAERLDALSSMPWASISGQEARQRAA